MRLSIKTLLGGAFLIFTGLAANAQVAIKTNAMTWASTTPNLGIEVGIGQHSTIQAMGMLNPWDFPHDRHFHMWMVQPEYRYWLCEKFNGHFFGAQLHGGEYNAKRLNAPLHWLMWGRPHDVDAAFNDPRDHESGWPDLNRADKPGRHVEGWYIGFGFTYGYQWVLSKHWNFEASIGLGYIYTPLKYYGQCNRIIDRRNLNYVGPTSAQLSIEYIF